MSIEVPFTKANLDSCLRELAKEFRKRGKGAHAEMIIIGGASVLINYGFRESTYDIDAEYDAPGVMKECINAVGDKLELPVGWINSDFKRTESFTPKLVQYSEYYRTYSNVLQIRTIRAEYLIAMKLVSGRKYKKDMSDIVGILYEQQRAGAPLSFEQIDQAVIDLYGNWDKISATSREILNAALAERDLQTMFIMQSESEAEAKEAIKEIELKYPGAVNQNNVNDVIAAAIARKNQTGEKKQQS